MLEPRKINQEEFNHLREYLFLELGCSTKRSEAEIANVDEIIKGAAIAVFNHYITDCPGYSGKVILVMWAGGIGMYEAFIYEEGLLIRVNQDKDFIKEDE